MSTMAHYGSLLLVLLISVSIPAGCADSGADKSSTRASSADTPPKSPTPASNDTVAVATSQWKAPPQDILDVLHAPPPPWVWTAPGGATLLLADPVTYPPLAEFAAPMHKLGGMRVDPSTHGLHGEHGATHARLVKVADGTEIALSLPQQAEVHTVRWTADGTQFALAVRNAGHLGLWIGSIGGRVREIKTIALNPLLGSPIAWMPDQARILVRRIPKLGDPPAPAAIPTGPTILEGIGEKARSTYEARDLLKTAHDDALFSHYATSELAVVDAATGAIEAMGPPGVYATADVSPDGTFVLVERLIGPWSHAVPWWRFATELDVWDARGKTVAHIASLPTANEIPVHGVRTGPRGVSWRPTAPHTLFWTEALDGGDPVATVPHRDRLVRLDAPFTGAPKPVFKAEHRIRSWHGGWGEAGGTLMLTQRERIRRWRYVWLLDVDNETARPWFDLNEDDSYASPGTPLHRPLANGQSVLRQQGDAVYFAGSGATQQGDRPFLDLRSTTTGNVQRLFRGPADRYESFVAFVGDDQHFVLSSESLTDVPNFFRVTLGAPIEAADGEATRASTREPITHFKDPTPQLRKIEKRIVQYKRKDGVPLSFQLHLPPGYKEGTRIPTVLYAYPQEYSDPSTAGQVRGSTQRFSRIVGPSPLFLLLRGYAVLGRTTMPMLGDPETTYDTFVPQLVADAEAAVAKAIDIGVADPDRIGIIGHSHGGLMVANLLAHTDLFAAGVARSGSYNKTNQPFGFQSERRSLFEARDVYIQLSPTFFADKVNEPVLIVHGDADANPGTLTFQSEVFFEAVRGSGGTARLVLLPHENHGYRARENIEHLLWEQLRWFDQHLKKGG